MCGAHTLAQKSSAKVNTQKSVCLDILQLKFEFMPETSMQTLLANALQVYTYMLISFGQLNYIENY